ncbi:hypothetical protein ACF07G_08355, partial [Streptomyces virginiae]
MTARNTAVRSLSAGSASEAAGFDSPPPVPVEPVRSVSAAADLTSPEAEPDPRDPAERPAPSPDDLPASAEPLRSLSPASGFASRDAAERPASPPDTLPASAEPLRSLSPASGFASRDAAERPASPPDTLPASAEPLRSVSPASGFASRDA